VEDIDTKVDVLLDMYKEDRAQQQQQQSTSSAAVQARPLSAVPPAHQRSAADERQSSEPCSPRWTASQQQRAVKPMLRNWSDLGPRIKKRVSYSASDSGGAGGTLVALDYKLALTHVHAAAPAALSQPPSIVSEEDEDQQQQQAAAHDRPGIDRRPRCPRLYIPYIGYVVTHTEHSSHAPWSSSCLHHCSFIIPSFNGSPSFCTFYYEPLQV